MGALNPRHCLAWCCTCTTLHGHAQAVPSHGTTLPAPARATVDSTHTRWDHLGVIMSFRGGPDEHGNLGPVAL
eukprot:364898-Chlamydomonas_euryale.AAC.8